MPSQNSFCFESDSRRVFSRVFTRDARATRMATNAGIDASRGAVDVRESCEDVVVTARGAETPNKSAPVQSFSSGVSEKNVSSVPVVVRDENALPNRPLTAFFTPQVRLPATDVFTALREANVESSDVSCLQRTSNGQVVLTFRRAECKELFLRKSVLKVGNTPYALQDVDRPLTYLQVYDAPHELPDLAIIQRLSQYCDVIHHRRGHFTQPGWEHVHDGVRHYRVRIKRPVPSFLRFDRYYVQFRYVGQPRTCRLCGQTNHLASACHTITCFNCEKSGHLASDCPCPVYCNICKSPAHRARTCPFSWSRLVDFPAPTSDSTRSNTEHSEHSENTESTESTESTNSDNATTDSNADISDPVLDNTPTDQPSDRPSETSETSPMDDDSPTVEETTMDQDSSDSTIQDYASASEENTMELFSEPQSSSRSAGSGRKPAKILDAFIPFRKPTAPTLVTSKPVREHSPDSDELSPKPKKPNTSRTNKHKNGKKKS